MNKTFCLLSAMFILANVSRAQSSITAGYTQSDFYQMHAGYEKLKSKNLYEAHLLINFSDNGEPPSQRAWENNWHAHTFWQMFGLGLGYGRQLYSHEKTKIHVKLNTRVSYLGIRNSTFVPFPADTIGTIFYQFEKINIEEPFWSIKPQVQFQISHPISKSLYLAVGAGAGFTFVYNHLKGDTIFVFDSMEPGFVDQLTYSVFAQLQYRLPSKN